MDPNELLQMLLQSMMTGSATEQMPQQVPQQQVGLAEVLGSLLQQPDPQQVTPIQGPGNVTGPPTQQGAPAPTPGGAENLFLQALMQQMLAAPVPSTKPTSQGPSAGQQDVTRRRAAIGAQPQGGIEDMLMQMLMQQMLASGAPA